MQIQRLGSFYQITATLPEGWQGQWLKSSVAEMACGQPVRSCWTLATNTLVFFQGTSKSACALLVLPLSGAGNLTYSQNIIQINSPLTLTPDSYPRNFFFFGLCWVFFAAGGFSLVAMGRVYSLGAVQWFLIAVASLVA